MNTGIQASVWVPVFSYLGHRPRSGTARPDVNSTFSFWRNLPNILFSFFLSSLVWNQLRSGSGFDASFPFSRSRCAVLICGNSRSMKPTSGNTEHGDCRKPQPANAWGSDGTFGRHSPADGRPAGACVVCSLSGSPGLPTSASLSPPPPTAELHTRLSPFSQSCPGIWRWRLKGKEQKRF